MIIEIDLPSNAEGDIAKLAARWNCSVAQAVCMALNAGVGLLLNHPVLVERLSDLVTEEKAVQE